APLQAIAFLRRLLPLSWFARRLDRVAGGRGSFANRSRPALLYVAARRDAMSILTGGASPAGCHFVGRGAAPAEEASHRPLRRPAARGRSGPHRHGAPAARRLGTFGRLVSRWQIGGVRRFR